MADTSLPSNILIELCKGGEIVKKMKAATVVAPHSIKIIEIPIPAPAENEVLVQVKYAGICGTDLKIYDGVASPI
jgi:D-arabinose 1-dehydrogenase-like Zn-dependent alcohol dehydrogenase